MLHKHSFCFLAALGLLGTAPLGAAGQVKTKTRGPAHPRTRTVATTPIANPVLAGDYPDPSVTKVGTTYWATATSSNWGPTFPLLKSTDLQHWALVGHVFPAERPAWADYYFWAPEINHDANGKIYVFYTAHQRGGNLAVGVASADRPEGPYHDHGPLVGQPDGSIDGFPTHDEAGQPYLIWKEDGNSVQQPTPIWAQRLNAARTALVGEKTELLRNTAAWEGNLVEGPSVVRHAGYFYLFYAANGCCGAGCTYATGVARAKNLLGPWEKYAQNPVLTNNATWTCPGHGTAIERNGHWYLLHHAYQAGNFQYVGRQGVLSEFTWTKSGWPRFLNEHSPPATLATTPPVVADEFAAPALALTWEWPVENKPAFSLQNGNLYLTARPDKGGAALGRSTLAASYTATTTLLNPGSLLTGTTAGIAALGDSNNSLRLLAGEGKIQLIERRDGKNRVLAETTLPTTAAVQLRLYDQGSNHYAFAWSPDGQTWTNLLPGNETADGRFLPPWDRGVRVGLVVQGPASATATFGRFELNNK
ncbi:MAG: family 43 glycosylhydrolase [Janthinobacterium lividum]